MTQALEICRAYGVTPLLTVHTLRGLDALTEALQTFGQPCGIVSSRKAVLEAWPRPDDVRLYRTDILTRRDLAYAQKTGCGVLADGALSDPALLRQAQNSVPLWTDNVHTRTVLRTLAQNGVTQMITDCILPIKKNYPPTYPHPVQTSAQDFVFFRPLFPKA